MKKLLCILLCGIMTLSLSSCTTVLFATTGQMMEETPLPEIEIPEIAEPEENVEETFHHFTEGVWMDEETQEESGQFDFLEFSEGTLAYGTMWSEWWDEPETLVNIEKIGDGEYKISKERTVYFHDTSGEKNIGETRISIHDGRYQTHITYLYMGRDINEAQIEYESRYW